MSALSIVGAVVLFYYSDRFLLRALQSREVGPGECRQLSSRVNILARRMGIPLPRVYLTGHAELDAVANLFSLGRHAASASIVLTPGLLKYLSDEELDAVIAHELSHIEHRETLCSGLSALIGVWLLALVPQNAESGARRLWSTMLFMVLAPIAAFGVRFLVDEAWEHRADLEGASLVGSAKGLSTALMKMDDLSKTYPIRLNEALGHLFFLTPQSKNEGVLHLFDSKPTADQRIDLLSQSEVPEVLK